MHFLKTTFFIKNMLDRAYAKSIIDDGITYCIESKLSGNADLDCLKV